MTIFIGHNVWIFGSCNELTWTYHVFHVNLSNSGRCIICTDGMNVLTIFSSADVAVSLVTCRVLPLPSRRLQRRKLWPISTHPASICGSTECHANPTSVDSAENSTYINGYHRKQKVHSLKVWWLFHTAWELNRDRYRELDQHNKKQSSPPAWEGGGVPMSWSLPVDPVLVLAGGGGGGYWSWLGYPLPPPAKTPPLVKDPRPGTSKQDTHSPPPPPPPPVDGQTKWKHHHTLYAGGNNESWLPSLSQTSVNISLQYIRAH